MATQIIQRLYSKFDQLKVDGVYESSGKVSPKIRSCYANITVFIAINFLRNE